MTQLPLTQPQVNYNQFIPAVNLSGYFSFITPQLSWVFIGIFGLFFGIMSYIFSYHWRRFGVDDFIMAKASLIYYCVSAVLWVMMVMSAVFYLNSV